MTNPRLTDTPNGLRGFMTLQNALVVLVGAGIGYALWVTAPALVKTQQPWDAAWPYYSAVLIAFGSFVRLVTSADYAAVFLGLWSGQIFAILGLYSPHYWGGPLAQASIGTISTGVGSLISLLGYLAGSAIRSKWR
jgi:hypothetical protein